MNYTTYDPATGQILSVLTTNDPLQVETNLADKSYIVGDYNGQRYYIDQGQAVEKPADPSGDTNSYTFDYATKNWSLDLDKTAFKARQYRYKMLLAVDLVSPVRYASLDTDQQTQLQTYRQALLDVPQQATFPESIEWPAKPTWL